MAGSESLLEAREYSSCDTREYIDALRQIWECDKGADNGGPKFESCAKLSEVRGDGVRLPEEVKLLRMRSDISEKRDESFENAQQDCDSQSDTTYRRIVRHSAI